ncbi:MAG: hypothetical protein J3K34DRAFT_417840 [Monoraphidium minutum]|nr:MAG: hypothetical protein J3K34DRAFT_417840 [Monoraphidium minutum]
MTQCSRAASAARRRRAVATEAPVLWAGSAPACGPNTRMHGAGGASAQAKLQSYCSRQQRVRFVCRRAGHTAGGGGGRSLAIVLKEKAPPAAGPGPAIVWGLNSRVHPWSLPCFRVGRSKQLGMGEGYICFSGGGGDACCWDSQLGADAIVLTARHRARVRQAPPWRAAPVFVHRCSQPRSYGSRLCPQGLRSSLIAGQVYVSRPLVVAAACHGRLCRVWRPGAGRREARPPRGAACV